MAISTNQSYLYRPSYQSPAYNPIIFTCYSQYYTYEDMRYIFDVYVNIGSTMTKVARIRQRPNPNGYGMLDISSIAQSYIDYSNEDAPITNGETTIDYINGKVYEDNNYLSKKMYIKVGEEYKVSGVLYTYNGLGNDSGNIGDPEYTMYSSYDSRDLPIFVWGCSLEDHQQQYHLSNPTDAGVIGSNPWIKDGGANKIFDRIEGTSYPLSFSSLNLTMYAYDKAVLSYLNYSPDEAEKDRVIYGFRFVFKDASGTTLSTQDVPVTASKGGNQRLTPTSSFTDLEDPDYHMIHVLASPNDLVTALGISAIVKFQEGYSIEITGYDHGAEGTFTFVDPITKTTKITIKESCDNPLYERVRLSWLNTLGGRDYLNFEVKNEKTIEFTEDTMYSEQMKWSQGPSPVDTISGPYTINRLGILGGVKPYNKMIKTTYSIESDWLDEDQIELLNGLQSSPQVMAYIHDSNNTFSDYYPYTVKLKNKSYVTKNYKQNKLIQGKFEIELVMPMKIQNTI